MPNKNFEADSAYVFYPDDLGCSYGSKEAVQGMEVSVGDSDRLLYFTHCKVCFGMTRYTCEWYQSDVGDYQVSRRPTYISLHKAPATQEQQHPQESYGEGWIK